VPDQNQPDAGRPERSAVERSADHAAIERLSAELLPALIAKLGATGLGEIEVREGAWRVRLRRPTDGAVRHDRRAGDRVERGIRPAAGSGAGALHGTPAPGPTPVGPGRDGRDGRGGRDGAIHDAGRIVASSPGVGIYQPRPETRAGTKVQAGDRLGSVDVLGIAQEVVAPVDGVVGASLVEPGDAVEYGQELIVIEFPSPSPSPSGDSAVPTPEV
jgi:biotin carboxyl carrier protein